MSSIHVIWSGQHEAHVIAPSSRPADCYRALLSLGIQGISEITPGSRTLQIRVHDDADPDDTLASVVSHMTSWIDAPSLSSMREVEIPICYDSDLAPDLEAIALNAGLTPDAAADLHASVEYFVRFLGFSPGFPYLDGLPEPLHTPRLNTPRTRVRPGSVGIAGARSGIYPQSTPGGWRLIGATPLRLFDSTRERATFLMPGDRVRFRRIPRDMYDSFQSDKA